MTMGRQARQTRFLGRLKQRTKGIELGEERRRLEVDERTKDQKEEEGNSERLGPDSGKHRLRCRPI